MKWLVFLALVALVVITRPWESLPPQWNPGAPLAIDHPMTPVTRWKLSQLADSPQQCLAALQTAPPERLDYLPLEDYTPVEGCPLSNVVRVRRSSIEFSSPFTLSCPLLVRWTMFEQQLHALAIEHLDSPVDLIEHYGSFACRNVYNRSSGRRSQHATASAFDVAAFTLRDGTRVSVLEHWDDPQQPERARFLRDVHSSACTYFGTVLGPDYNQPHENHFHFDTSGFNLCR